MTIYEGSEGSLNLFWKDLFISSFPLSKKKKLELYEYEGTHLITEALKDNVPFNTLHKVFEVFCEGVYKRWDIKRAYLRLSEMKLFRSLPR